jgi:peptidoglycan/xylan/chitin deacetylase (PgdA/CDA1 family)
VDLTELAIVRIPMVSEDDATAFEAYLDWLKVSHYVTVSPDEVYKWLSGEGEIASKPILLTFDEGGASLYDIVYPLLVERNMKATIYLATGFIDEIAGLGPFAEDEPMTWQEIKAMQESGLITFGTMGRNGADLTDPSYTSEYIQNDLFVAKLRIQNILGVACNHAAYPKGKINSRVKAAMGACGFETCRAYNLYDSTLSYDLGTPKLTMINSQPFMLSSYASESGFPVPPTPVQPPNEDLAPAIAPAAWSSASTGWTWDEDELLFEGVGTQAINREYLAETTARYLRKRDTRYFITAQLDATITDGSVGIQVLEYNKDGTQITSSGSPDIRTYATLSAVAHVGSPYITIYKRSGDTFTKLSNPTDLPTSTGRAVSFDPTGTYLAVAHDGSPYITIYKRSGDTFTKLSNPSSLPTGNGYGVSFDPTGMYLAVAHEVSPYVTVYKRTLDTFAKLPNPADLPTGHGRSVLFDPTGAYLAVGHTTTPFITVYKRDGDVFTKLPSPTDVPAGDGWGLAFTSNSTYLAVGHSNTPFITVYKREGDVFTKLTDPIGTLDLPSDAVWGLSFDPTGTYLAAGVQGGTGSVLLIYKRSGDTFTKLSDPAAMPPNTVYWVAFDPTGTYLAVAHDNSPYLTIYKRSGDTFTKLSNPSSLPTGTGVSVVFAPSNQYPTNYVTGVYTPSSLDVRKIKVAVFTNNPLATVKVKDIHMYEAMTI